MKYRPNKKNGGIAPVWHDRRVLTVPIGCGNCIECRKQKSREWQLRLQEEVRHDKNGKFITLTFSNEQIKNIIEGKDTKGKIITEPLKEKGYTLDNKIATIAVRRFLEIWRKEHKQSLKHWFVTELGHNGTENIHLHGIIWTEKPIENVEKNWKYGWIWKGKRNKWGSYDNYVSEKTVNYITKYVSKVDQKHKEYKSKILVSPGIGKEYTNRPDSKNNKYKKGETKETYTTRTGHKMAMPTYWRNKIYSEEEREKLWLEKLDKQERWVLGQRIDISKTEQEYYKILNAARNKNKRLGYGDGSINWDRKIYENQRRELKLNERLKASPAKGISPSGDGLAQKSIYGSEVKTEENTVQGLESSLPDLKPSTKGITPNYEFDKK